MRLVFALLLFANIAWFAWTQWVAAPDAAAVATSAPAPGTKLLLAREAPPTKPAARPSPRSGSHCLSLGPFTDLTDAARAATLLRENQLEPRQRAGEGVVWK